MTTMTTIFMVYPRLSMPGDSQMSSNANVENCRARRPHQCDREMDRSQRTRGQRYTLVKAKQAVSTPQPSNGRLRECLTCSSAWLSLPGNLWVLNTIGNSNGAVAPKRKLTIGENIANSHSVDARIRHFRGNDGQLGQGRLHVEPGLEARGLREQRGHAELEKIPDAPRKKPRIASRPSNRPKPGLSHSASSVNSIAIPSASYWASHKAA